MRTPDGATCPAGPSDVSFKACVADADCTPAFVPECCGNTVIAIAQTATDAFAACFPAIDCKGYACAVGLGLQTENGQRVPCDFTGSLSDCVDVACVAGQCRSGAPAVDAEGGTADCPPGAPCPCSDDAGVWTCGPYVWPACTTGMSSGGACDVDGGCFACPEGAGIACSCAGEAVDGGSRSWVCVGTEYPCPQQQ